MIRTRPRWITLALTLSTALGCNKPMPDVANNEDQQSTAQADDREEGASDVALTIGKIQELAQVHLRKNDLKHEWRQIPLAEGRELARLLNGTPERSLEADGLFTQLMPSLYLVRFDYSGEETRMIGISGDGRIVRDKEAPEVFQVNLEIVPRIMAILTKHANT